MRLRRLIEDNDAVSPVIGVILMVAITVILAAVIASFVLGLGPGEAQPQASFSFDEKTNSSTYVTITHDNGDSIPETELFVRGDIKPSDERWDKLGGDVNSESEVTSGNSVEVEVDSDYSVRVVWDNGDNSATLSES